MKLRDINFGNLDAQSEAQTLVRNDVFFESQAWEAAKDKGKWFILGRKGAGKSALRLMLEHQASLGRPWVNLSFLQFPTESLGTILDQTRKNALYTDRRFFASTWRYAIIFAVANRLVRSGQISDAPRRLNKCKAVLDGSGSSAPRAEDGRLNFSLVNLFIDAAEMCGSHLAGKSDPAEKTAFPFGTTARECERELVHYLKDRGLHIPVFIDDLDYDLHRFDDVVHPLLLGLIDAVREHYLDYPDSPIAIKAFLPTDVMPTNYRDLDKVGYYVMEWTKSELAQLIARRVHLAGRGVGGMPTRVDSGSAAESVLKHVFPSLSGGHDYRDTITWLCHSTHMRPRDLQKVLNELRQAKCKEDANATCWSEDDIYRFLPEVLKKLANQIQGEFSARYPDIGVVMHRFQERNAEINRGEFCSLIAGIPGLARKDAQVWIDALYECGFLCTVITQETRPGASQPRSKFAMCSWHQSLTPGDHVLADDFVVHRLFWDRFSISPPRGWSFRYPGDA